MGWFNHQRWSLWDVFFPEVFCTFFWNGVSLHGGFKYFLFPPYLGKIPILTNIFQRGWNHQPVLFWVKSNLNQAILEKRKVYEKGFVTEEGKTQFLDVLNVEL